MDKLKEAFHHFQKAYDNDNTHFKSLRNLQNLKNQLVERWHFPMLNDNTRNKCYQKAIHKWHEDGNKDGRILDIGTGSGILSLYANQSGTSQITACDRSETMIEIADSVFKANNINTIKLIPKLSTDIVVDEKFDLIVTEILDSGVFGEGILQTLIHAKKHLLKETGQIIPWKVKIFISGFQSRSISSNYILLNENFKEYIFLDKFNITVKSEEPYDAEHVDSIHDFKVITTTEEFEINFNDLEIMKDYFSGQLNCKIKLTSDFQDEQDCIDGFVVWFNLYMDQNDPENFVSTAPGQNSCWNQSIFRLKKPVLLNKYQQINARISCKDGILNLKHNLNSVKLHFLEVDDKILKFLNDEIYLSELENSVFESIKKHKKVEHVADFLPFPYIGLILLKEQRLKRLFCRKEDQKLIKKICAFNCIDASNITFVKNPVDLLDDAERIKFDVICFSPFDPLGDLDNKIICEMDSLRPLLKPCAVLVPNKIQVYGVLINSDWLYNSCKITDPDIKSFKIDQFLNKFATEQHLDLNTNFPYERLTDEFKISDIQFSENFHQSQSEVFMRNINLEVHAILCHFKIQFTKKCDDFYTTKSKTSHIRMCAFIMDEPFKVEGSHVKVEFKQNFGIIKCNLESSK